MKLTTSFASLVYALCFLCPIVNADTTLKTDAVKQAVVFIYAAKANGTDADDTKPIGTGFLVFAPHAGRSRLLGRTERVRCVHKVRGHRARRHEVQRLVGNSHDLRPVADRLKVSLSRFFLSVE